MEVAHQMSTPQVVRREAEVASTLANIYDYFVNDTAADFCPNTGLLSDLSADYKKYLKQFRGTISGSDAVLKMIVNLHSSDG